MHTHHHAYSPELDMSSQSEGGALQTLLMATQCVQRVLKPSRPYGDIPQEGIQV